MKKVSNVFGSAGFMVCELFVTGRDLVSGSWAGEGEHPLDVPGHGDQVPLAFDLGGRAGRTVETP